MALVPPPARSLSGIPIDPVYVMPRVGARQSAQRSRDPNGYITAVAYTLAAAIHAVGAWDYSNKPIEKEKVA